MELSLQLSADSPIMFTIKLEESDRPALLAHFLALSAEDRHLRFGCSVADISIERYVAGIDFNQDVLFSVNANSRHFEGIAHLALDKGHAELGVSVLEPYRGRGIGSALVSRAAVHARNRHIDVLFMQCLSENCVIMRIAAALGMRVVTQGPESEASLSLPSATPLSRLREMVADSVALCDAALRERLLPHTLAAPSVSGKEHPAKRQAAA